MKINHIIKEFVTPQATAQDPGLEREKDVDVIFYGQMPRDFTANDVIEALEAVLPREYPPGTSHNTIGIPDSKAERIALEISKHQGAVVTTKPLSVAQKLVKTFQTYGIKCTIRNSGLDEDITRRGFLQGAGAAVAAAAGGSAMAQSQMPKVDQVDRQKMTIVLDGQEYPLVILSATDFRPRGGQPVHITCAQMGERCMGRYDALLTQGRVFVLPGMKPPTIPQGVAEDDAGDVEQRMIAKIAKEKQRLAKLKQTDPEAYQREIAKRKTSGRVPPVSTFEGVAEGTAGLPDPNDFDSDWEYQDAMDAYGKVQDTDSDFENMIDEPNDWFDESKEKVGNMDADAFDAALARMKKLAGAGPLKTVWDPAKRVYKNVPTAVQPAQQPRKEKK